MSRAEIEAAVEGRFGLSGSRKRGHPRPGNTPLIGQLLTTRVWANAQWRNSIGTSTLPDQVPISIERQVRQTSLLQGITFQALSYETCL